jgi:phosphatidate cytidylyltransferase
MKKNMQNSGDNENNKPENIESFDSTPSPSQKGGENLARRVIVALILFAGSIALVFWGALPFAFEILFLSIVGVAEFYDMSVRKGIRPSRSSGFIAVILLVAFSYQGKDEYFAPFLLGLVMITMLMYLFRKGFHVSSFLDVGVTVLGFLYVGWFFSYLIKIRLIEGNPFNLLGYQIERGAGLVLLLVFANHLTDVGAYFAGKSFGKHKMAPHVSPNKTIEGAIGGMIGALAGAFLIGSLLKISKTDLLTIGILCGIFSQLGDIWASVLKRDVKVKDSGNLILGHGGVLDRFDSLLFSAPVFFYYMKYFY